MRYLSRICIYLFIAPYILHLTSSSLKCSKHYHIPTLPEPRRNKSSTIAHVFSNLEDINASRCIDNISGIPCYTWPCQSLSRKGESCTWCLPAVIVVGVSKCGTTAICRKLSTHPDIKTYRKKEINIFSKYHVFSWESLERKVSDNKRSLKGHYWMDCSSGVFRDFNAAVYIKHYSPRTKVVFMVRDPWQRLGSWMAMVKRNNDPQEYTSLIQRMQSKMISHQYKDNIRTSRRAVYHLARVNDYLYAEIILNWLTVFSMRSIHVIDHYDLENHPNETMRKLEDFMGLHHHNYANRTLLSVSKNAVLALSDSVDSNGFGIVQKNTDPALHNARTNAGIATQIHPPYTFDDKRIIDNTKRVFIPSLCLFEKIFGWSIKIVTEGIE